MLVDMLVYNTVQAYSAMSSAYSQWGTWTESRAVAAPLCTFKNLSMSLLLRGYRRGLRGQPRFKPLLGATVQPFLRNFVAINEKVEASCVHDLNDIWNNVESNYCKCLQIFSLGTLSNAAWRLISTAKTEIAKALYGPNKRPKKVIRRDEASSMGKRFFTAPCRVKSLSQQRQNSARRLKVTVTA
jgi:hypothetical protein